jgi:hypothetical protein
MAFAIEAEPGLGFGGRRGDPERGDRASEESKRRFDLMGRLWKCACYSGLAVTTRDG